MSDPVSEPVSDFVVDLEEVDESVEESIEESFAEEEVEAEAEPGFEAFDLSEEVLSSLKKIGYTKPTEVQQLCIPVLVGENAVRDIVALARTGTGKTAAFGIPLVESVDTSKRQTQALVLCPTRELCVQVANSVTQIGYTKRVKVLSVYGGDSYRRQFEGLKQGPHIVVATPGRLIDLLDRGAVDLKSVQTLVLDEADEMISVGFREALDQILKSFSERSLEQDDDQDEDGDSKPQQHRTWLFSATMSADVKRVQSRYIKNAKFIDATRGQVEKPLIRQQFMMTFEEDRLEALKRYLHIHDDFYGLIFCQTKAEVAEVEAALRADGFKVDALHGDKAQREREAVFAAWKKKQIKIVVATDVAARGLDVQGLTHVVNMSIPREDESYVHRIGRTGRAGREGIALSFVWPKRAPVLRQLERKLGVKLEQVQVPEPAEVARAVLGREVKALFENNLEFKEENPIHQMVAELITASGVEVSPEVLPHLAGLTAKVLEKKNPGLLNRPFVKVLRADGPGVSQGYGGRSGGPRDRRGGDRPRGGYRSEGRGDGGGYTRREYRDEGGGRPVPRGGGDRDERRRPSFGGDRPERSEGRSFRPEGRRFEEGSDFRAERSTNRPGRPFGAGRPARRSFEGDSRPGQHVDRREGGPRPSAAGAPRLRDRFNKKSSFDDGGFEPPRKRGPKAFESRQRDE